MTTVIQLIDHINWSFLVIIIFWSV